MGIIYILIVFLKAILFWSLCCVAVSNLGHFLNEFPDGDVDVPFDFRDEWQRSSWHIRTCALPGAYLGYRTISFLARHTQRDRVGLPTTL